MSWIYYLLEANLYLVLFYAVYYLLLRRDTYYQLNRIYLLTSSLVAFAIPLMRLGFLKPAPIEYGQVITQVSSIPLAPVGHFTTGIAAAHPVVTINYYLLVYIGIACLMAVGFMVRIYQLAKLARGGKQLAGDNFKLIEIEDEDHAFSFFSYLFISKKLTSSNTIIQHELVHIRQKHSIDIIYLELLKIICWFNPIVYLLQNSIKEVHEFIADNQIASAQQDVNYYTDFLISNAYGLPETALANNFFTKNLLKNRIMMLHQKRSGSLARLKLLVALPLLCGMLCLSTLGFTKDYSLIDLAPVQTKQVPPPPPPAPPVVVPDKAKMPPPPPPPIMLNNAYIGVGRYMQHNLKYPQTATKNKVKGAVILNFRLDDKGMITDVKVDKSVGSGLDEEAIRLFNSYKKPIKDKAGYHTIGIDFNVKGVNAIELVSAEAKNKPGFVGELYLPGSGLGEGPSKVGQIRFPPPVVKPDVAPPKPKVSQIRFPPPVVKPDAAPPKPKVTQIRFPPPVVKPDAAPPKPKVTQMRFPPPVVRPDDTTGAAAFSDFYAQVGKNVRYASEMREKNIQGRVLVVFNIDDDRNIRNIKIVKGLTDVQNMEVVNRLRNCYVPQSAKTGVNYTIPISFLLKGEDGREIKSPLYQGKTYTADYKPNNYPYKSLQEVVIIGYGSPAVK